MSEEIAARLLTLCAARGPGKTICPSEVARALAQEETQWRALMPEVRNVAARLAQEGRIAVTQRGREVDLETARGAIRLSLRSKSSPKKPRNT